MGAVLRLADEIVGYDGTIYCFMSSLESEKGKITMYFRGLFRITTIVLVLTTALIAGVVVAQDDENHLEYGAEVNAVITNRTFEILYTFDGQAGDIVRIEMFADANTDLDPQLFLGTQDNTLLISNDDAYNRDSRIVFRLPQDATYVIIAARLSGRFGSGGGGYTLRLDKVDPITIGVTSEGRVSSQGQPPVLIFVAESTGTYTISYRHIQGRYYPAFIMARLSVDSSYPEEVGRIDGLELESGAITLNLNADDLYTLSLVRSNYNYSSDDETALYTIRVDETQ